MASSNDRGCSETGCGLGACVIDSVSLTCPVTVRPFVSAPDDRRLALSQKAVLQRRIVFGLVFSIAA
jgi:hypothetical protein